MYRFKSGTICATLFSALWLTGCVSAPPEAETNELKQVAMQRWTACLERNVDVRIMPALQINKLLSQNCEGHKRDVLALYPRRMAGQVDQMLTSDAYRFIESMSDSQDESILIQRTWSSSIAIRPFSNPTGLSQHP